MQTGQILNHVLKALKVAKQTEEKLGTGAMKKTGTRGYGGDMSIKADIEVEKKVIAYFKNQKLPFRLVSEEKGFVNISKPEYFVTLDPIDGSSNYSKSRDTLPYCTVISVFDSLKPKYKDVLVAAIIEHHSNKIWYAVRGAGCFVGNPKSKCKVSTTKSLSRATWCIINSNHRRNLKVFKHVFQKGYARNFGTSALHFSMIAEGSSDAYMDTEKHQNELGAGYLLIKEAGGFVTDLKGKDFADSNYIFNQKREMVCASTKQLLDKIVKGI